MEHQLSRAMGVWLCEPGPSTVENLRNGHAFGDPTESSPNLSGIPTISLPIMHQRKKSAVNELNPGVSRIITAGAREALSRKNRTS